MVQLKTPALRNDGSLLSQNILKILETRYLLKDTDGNIIETPDELFRRVANTIAQSEDDSEYWSDKFYQQMSENNFLPNSPTMMNAGLKGTLSACFVIGVEDDMKSILYAGEKAGMVLKYGGGVGYYLGNLRSKGQKIATTHGNACGPIAVLRFFNEVSKMITQGGKRNGANMAILPIDHPDIQEFIHCKDANAGASEENQVIDQFNISISITDKFLTAVNNNEPWELIDPASQEIIKTVSAKKLMTEIIESAHATGDPGLFFVDQVNRKNTTPNLGKLESTNPCGEVPLYPEEACNLGSINLSNFYNEETSSIDKTRLQETVTIATRFLDNVVTENDFPIEEITQAVAKTRKLGLGVMGWHDLLLKMNIPYDTTQAAVLGAELMNDIQKYAREESARLADIRGNFPAYEGSIFDTQLNIPQRNATVTCIAPTGTISRIAGASSGIEPVFAWAFKSNIMRGQIEEPFTDIHPIFEEYFKTNYPEMFDQILEHVIKYGTIVDLNFISDEEKELFKTSNEISIKSHIRHQASFQQATDLAVSKTINFKNSATFKDVEDAYNLAALLECKGITIYRDGSRYQILNTGINTVKDSEEKEKENSTNSEEQEVLNDFLRDNPEGDVLQKIDIPSLNTDNLFGTQPAQLPWKLESKRYKVPTPLGASVLVHISSDDDENPKEVVLTIGKSGSDIQTASEALGRLITLALKYSAPLAEILKQLSGINSGKISWFNGDQIQSLPDAVAYAIKDFINNPNIVETLEARNTALNINVCPECNGTLMMQEGCEKCPACGYSAC